MVTVMLRMASPVVVDGEQGPGNREQGTVVSGQFWMMAVLRLQACSVFQCAPTGCNYLQPPAVGRTALARDGVRGFPPFPQKKAERMGHPDVH